MLPSHDFLYYDQTFSTYYIQEEGDEEDQGFGGARLGWAAAGRGDEFMRIFMSRFFAWPPR